MKELFYKCILKRWILILTTILVSCFVVYIVSSFFVTKKYSSIVEMNYTNGDEEKANQTSLTIVARCAQAVKENVYLDILKEYIDEFNYSQETLSELKLSKSYSVEEIKKNLKTSVNKDSFSFKIEVISANAKDAKLISDAFVSETMLENLAKIVIVDEINGLDNFKIYQRPYINSKPISPKTYLNVIITFFISLIASCGLCVCIELLDGRVKGKEDLIIRYNLPILAKIPEAVDEAKYNDTAVFDSEDKK